ncbi:MFS general substrate transporter [Flagelloscypha sp. PMI_526]|nr:MFS general substrate transporter [Flagelloscypha sp. PMI_526]
METDNKTEEDLTNRIESEDKMKEYLVLEKVQLGALIFGMFSIGWNDGTLGPLIPRIQEYYHVNYTIVSLVFIFTFVGAMIAALANVYLIDHLGFGKILLLSTSMAAIGFALLGPALPFPVFLVAYVFIGFGMSLNDAQCSGYVAMMPRGPKTKMGFLHATYGCGALVGPIVSTQFSKMEHWNYHYIASAGLMVPIIISHLCVFQGQYQNECLRRIGREPPIESAPTSAESHAKFRQIFRNKAMYLLSLFLLAYVGLGNTMSSWIVTFLIKERGGTQNSGYVSAGFYGGIALGRVLLIPINKKLTEQRAIYLWTLLSIAFLLISWLIPKFLATAIAIPLMGLSSAPFYPIAMNHAARVIPPEILTGCIGVIAAISFSGTAVFPFLNGALTQRYGPGCLNPLCLALLVCIGGIWWSIPKEMVANEPVVSSPSESEKTSEA